MMSECGENWDKIGTRARCCCCGFGDSELSSMLEPHDKNGHSEVYSTMIAECFGLEMKFETVDVYKDLCIICKVCIARLRDALYFRHRVENAYSRIQDFMSNYISSTAKCQLKTLGKYDIIKSEQIYLDNDMEDDEILIINVKKESVDETSLFESDLPKFKEKHMKNKITENENKSKKKIISNNPKLKSKIVSNKKKSTIRKAARLSLNTDLKCDMSMMSGVSEEVTNSSKVINKIDKRRRKKKNIQFHLEVDDLNCKICGEAFTWQRTLKQHMAVHFPNYICHICSKTFLNSGGLRRHVLSHEEEICYTCDICNKTIKAKDNFKQHMKIHNNSVRKFKCLYCTEEFTNFSQRNKHLIVVHDDKTKLYHCKYCTKEFSSNGCLIKHTRRVHLKIKNHECETCGMKFCEKSELNGHLSSHTSIKEFHCETCNKSYSRKKSLVAHMKIHKMGSEKPQTTVAASNG